MLYISRMVRPDLMHRASELARFMHNPGPEHWKACQHLCRYLKGTKHEKLVYKCNPDITPDNFYFVGHVDASHAPDYGHEFKNHKCTMGWGFSVNDVFISWRSRKGPVLTDSSGASEFLAAADASKQAIWLRRLFADFGHPQKFPTVLREDNESCEKLVRNYCGHDRIKHLDIRASVIREHHARQLIEMQRTPGPDQVADNLTKVNGGPQTTRWRKWMLHGDVTLTCQEDIETLPRNRMAG